MVYEGRKDTTARKLKTQNGWAFSVFISIGAMDVGLITAILQCWLRVQLWILCCCVLFTLPYDKSGLPRGNIKNNALGVGAKCFGWDSFWYKG